MITFVFVMFAFAVIANFISSSVLIGLCCAGALVCYIYDQFFQAFADSPLQWLHILDLKRAFGPITSVQILVLVPFVFASIANEILVKDLFVRQTAWYGIVYIVFMFLAKLAAGGVLLSFDPMTMLWTWVSKTTPKGHRGERETELRDDEAFSLPPGVEDRRAAAPSDPMGSASNVPQFYASTVPNHMHAPVPTTLSWSTASAHLELSLVARGDIRFLIINYPIRPDHRRYRRFCLVRGI
ncbi:hypothetical protein K437DRAFT_256730 [Tilletiaria anomala UBC 951]|uniref:Cation/H+ exchanger domain-containing protein n=1 Tax=Tilletiaria anomala (strain ATCC 24038 / CBS 436.72 / UBC 951) TaxID=1037660 RepID=A0A066W1W7_TILAU|nr:uncharacterized protein K437DRAFT_256730 [Tilletiaria anomala UBC 951]KDN45074.1 hypothetical protein K437DRAFT_256730 [Tilletiaria anomala UBC 951]